MKILATDKALPDLNGYTLVMPSVCVGNVGQLAVDLLINNLTTEKVGVLHHPALYPMVGGDPYNEASNQVATSADLYTVLHTKFLLLQIRAPLIKGQHNKFLTDLLKWCVSRGVQDVVVLAACSATERWNHEQFSGSMLRYLTARLPPHHLQQLKLTGVSELEQHEGRPQHHVPGAGFVKQLLDVCELPVVVVLKFVHEGDNTQDAITLAGVFNAWKQVIKDASPTWNMPFSWRNMFGGAPPPSIY